MRPLENTLIKLLKSLDFYDDSGREKIAIGARPTGFVASQPAGLCQPAFFLRACPTLRRGLSSSPYCAHWAL